MAQHSIIVSILLLKRERKDTGSLQHFSPLSPIFPAVSRPILMEFDTQTPIGSESVFVQLPRARTFGTEAVLDVWDGHRQPRTFGTDTCSLGHLGWTWTASVLWDRHRLSGNLIFFLSVTSIRRATPFWPKWQLCRKRKMNAWHYPWCHWMFLVPYKKCMYSLLV